MYIYLYQTIYKSKDYVNICIHICIFIYIKQYINLLTKQAPTPFTTASFAII